MVLPPPPSTGPLPLSRSTSRRTSTQSCVDQACTLRHDPSDAPSPDMVSEQNIRDTLENLRCCIDSLSCREILETESAVGKIE